MGTMIVENAIEAEIKTLKNCVDQFLLYCSVERGLADSYVKSYGVFLFEFIDFFKSQGIEYLSQVSRNSVREFLMKKFENAPSGNSKCKVIGFLRTFGKFLGREYQWDNYQLFAELETPRREHKIPEILSEQEIGKLIEQPLIILIREWALLETLYSTGCRIDEICSLRYCDLKLDSGTAVVTGKGRKQRIVFLNEKSKSAISLLQEALYNQPVNPESFVFANPKYPNKKLNNSTASEILKKYACMSGVAKRVYPHIFRHSFATHLLENGANIMEVKEMLGHVDVSTTQIYTHISQEKIRRDHGLLFDSQHGQEYWEEKTKELNKQMRALDSILRVMRKNPLFTNEECQEIVHKADLMKRFTRQPRKLPMSENGLQGEKECF